jgi:hypothetical protein
MNSSNRLPGQPDRQASKGGLGGCGHGNFF